MPLLPWRPGDTRTQPEVSLIRTVRTLSSRRAAALVSPGGGGGVGGDGGSAGLLHHAEPPEAAPLLGVRPSRLLLRPGRRRGHRAAPVAPRGRAVPDRGRAGERVRAGAGEVPGRAELRAVLRAEGEAVRPGRQSVPLLLLPRPAEHHPSRPPHHRHLLLWCRDPVLLRGHRLLLLQRLRSTLRDAAGPSGALPVDLHLLSEQLPGDDPVRVGGEAPPSVRAHRQLQRGELRVPDVQRAIRPILLALLLHLRPARTQRRSDPTGWNPVSVPGEQRGGAGRRRCRPHVLRRPDRQLQETPPEAEAVLPETRGLGAHLVFYIC